MAGTSSRRIVRDLHPYRPGGSRHSLRRSPSPSYEAGPARPPNIACGIATRAGLDRAPEGRSPSKRLSAPFCKRWLACHHEIHWYHGRPLRATRRFGHNLALARSGTNTVPDQRRSDCRRLALNGNRLVNSGRSMESPNPARSLSSTEPLCCTGYVPAVSSW